MAGLVEALADVYVGVDWGSARAVEPSWWQLRILTGRGCGEVICQCEHA